MDGPPAVSELALSCIVSGRRRGRYDSLTCLHATRPAPLYRGPCAADSRICLPACVWRSSPWTRRAWRRKSARARIVAVGDIHGAGTGLVQILQAAGLIDAQRKWSGGTARLVQTGDILDRGTEVREAIDLLMRLEGEARRAGGRVDALFGNHEGHERPP